MISHAQFQSEVDAMLAEMIRAGTPDDVMDKIVIVLDQLYARLWPKAVGGSEE